MPRNHRPASACKDIYRHRLQEKSLVAPQGDVIPGGEGGAQKECTGTHTYAQTYNILRNFSMERVALRRNAQVHIHTLFRGISGGLAFTSNYQAYVRA